MTQEKAQILGSCSSCLDTPPPLLSTGLGPLSLRALGLLRQPMQGIPSAVLGEQRPRSAPASPSCPHVPVTAPGCDSLSLLFAGRVRAGRAQEVQSCPHFVGAQQRRRVTESAGLSGENNEAHTHEEAHITGTWPESNVIIQEGLPCQSRSPNNYLLTRTEDPSSEDLSALDTALTWATPLRDQGRPCTTSSTPTGRPRQIRRLGQLQGCSVISPHPPLPQPRP